MSTKSVKGSQELGNMIRERRIDLGFTIEEAAAKAGVGLKTWCRYEAGESIRSDKVMKVCKALNWNSLPGLESDLSGFDIEEYRQSKIWPQALADSLGEAAAVSFVIGSDILLDSIEEDLQLLSQKPKGTHIGELELSWLKDILPPQFLPQYDYDFLYYMKTVLIRYRRWAKSSQRFIAHSVMEELILYLVMEESRTLMENYLPNPQKGDDNLSSDWQSWPFDLFDDMDVVTCLYSDFYLMEDNIYHFSHWRKDQFYMD